MEEIIITSEIVSEICGYVRAGTSFEIASMAAGFKQEQIEEMGIILSSAADGVWKEFADDIKKAVAQFEVMQLMKINAEGGTKGAQWLLERINPEKWEKSHKRSVKKKNLNQNNTKLLADNNGSNRQEIDMDLDLDIFDGDLPFS